MTGNQITNRWLPWAPWDLRLTRQTCHRPLCRGNEAMNKRWAWEAPAADRLRCDLLNPNRCRHLEGIVGWGLARGWQDGGGNEVYAEPTESGKRKGKWDYWSSGVLDPTQSKLQAQQQTQPLSISASKEYLPSTVWLDLPGLVKHAFCERCVSGFLFFPFLLLLLLLLLLNIFLLTPHTLYHCNSDTEEIKK